MLHKLMNKGHLSMAHHIPSRNPVPMIFNYQISDLRIRYVPESLYSDIFFDALQNILPRASSVTNVSN